MEEKPIVLMEHATRRYVALNLTPDIIRDAIRSGKKVRLAKQKASATMHTKKGTIVVIFTGYPDHTALITITKGVRRK